MKILVVEPEKEAEVREIENKLEDLQKIVGGYIEVVSLGQGVTLVCDEEGKIKGKQPNWDVNGDLIVGTFFLCGSKGSDFASLTEEQIKWCKEMTSTERDF